MLPKLWGGWWAAEDQDVAVNITAASAITDRAVSHKVLTRGASRLNKRSGSYLILEVGRVIAV